MNAPTFKPGDPAITRNMPCACCNGLRVTVVAGPDKMVVKTGPTTIDVRFGYAVRLADERTRLFCEPHQLRPIDPPAPPARFIESDATPNKLSQFDPAIWAPSTEIVL